MRMMCITSHMASTFMPHSRTATTIVCSTNSLLLLRFTLSRSFHFYCCKRLLRRNNTATVSAPHERCQHLLRDALPLSCGVTKLRLFQRFFLSPLLIPSCQLTRPCQDISSRHRNSQFRIKDQSGTLFQVIHPANQQKAKGTHATSCSSSDLHLWCTSHNLRLVTKSLV